MLTYIPTYYSPIVVIERIAFLRINNRMLIEQKERFEHERKNVEVELVFVLQRIMNIRNQSIEISQRSD